MVQFRVLVNISSVSSNFTNPVWDQSGNVIWKKVLKQYLRVYSLHQKKVYTWGKAKYVANMLQV